MPGNDLRDISITSDKFVDFLFNGQERERECISREKEAAAAVVRVSRVKPPEDSPSAIPVIDRAGEQAKDIDVLMDSTSDFTEKCSVPDVGLPSVVLGNDAASVPMLDVQASYPSPPDEVSKAAAMQDGNVVVDVPNQDVGMKEDAEPVAVSSRAVASGFVFPNQMLMTPGFAPLPTWATDSVIPVAGAIEVPPSTGPWNINGPIDSRQPSAAPPALTPGSEGGQSVTSFGPATPGIIVSDSALVSISMM